jgi:anthranilate phosphoribosyltransferase
MLTEITQKIIAKENLTFDQAQDALKLILDGQCEPVAIAAFLTALAAKGETATEVAGLAQAMRDHAVPVTPESKDIIDIVGTGGDGAHTFNISTTTAFVVAGCGVKVAKHGNRAITSQCGSADLLDALGVKIDATPEVIAHCIDQAGIGFMFAPCHHPAMKHVQPIRKALGFRTVFNILGPLANPANVSAQFTGVARPELLPVMAEALKELGTTRAIVAHSAGMDEMSLHGISQLAILENNKIIYDTLDPKTLNLEAATPDKLKGGSLEDNAKLTISILENKTTGPCQDVVLLNAAAALIVAEKANDFSAGIDQANESIKSGAAKTAMEQIIKISNES